jgi:pyruvate/2-oxoglutarate/acetoin dehydrogenase E1 component
MAELRMREALRDAMAEEMRRDEGVFVMGEDVAVFQGAFKVTEGLIDECATRRSPRTRSSAPGSGQRWAGCGRLSS